jgi:hypothetical protein
VQVAVVTPLCLALGVAAALVWNDVLAGVLHALLAWALTWLVVLASLWLLDMLIKWFFSETVRQALAEQLLG